MRTGRILRDGLLDMSFCTSCTAVLTKGHQSISVSEGGIPVHCHELDGPLRAACLGTPAAHTASAALPAGLQPAPVAAHQCLAETATRQPLPEQRKGGETRESRDPAG